MNHDKLSRALRYYYPNMLEKTPGKRYVYRFVCDLEAVLKVNFVEIHNWV